jgi:hypothetical protein
MPVLQVRCLYATLRRMRNTASSVAAKVQPKRTRTGMAKSCPLRQLRAHAVAQLALVQSCTRRATEECDHQRKLAWIDAMLHISGLLTKTAVVLGALERTRRPLALPIRLRLPRLPQLPRGRGSTPSPTSENNLQPIVSRDQWLGCACPETHTEDQAQRRRAARQSQCAQVRLPHQRISRIPSGALALPACPGDGPRAIAGGAAACTRSRVLRDRPVRTLFCAHPPRRDALRRDLAAVGLRL